MGAVLRLYIPDWPLGRAALSLSAYGGLVAVLGIMLCVTPAQALLSNTGYARIASPSSMNALSVAQRSLTSSAVGAAIANASGPGSVAVRLVTSSVGWPALGVLAGLTLVQIVLSSNQVQDIKAAAGTPGIITIPGSSVTVLNKGDCAGAGTSCIVSPYDAVIAVHGCSQSPGTGWQFYTATGVSPNLVCYYRHIIGNDSTLPVVGPSTPATQQQLTDYVNGLPASDPNSIESNSTAVGVGVAPSPAATVATVPVNATDVGTAVVPASSVSPTDTVVNPSAPAPSGTQTTTILPRSKAISPE